MVGIELKSLHKQFGDVKVLRDIDLKIKDGAFTILVGPSGCGKSTLLRVIAGLEEVSAGDVEIDGKHCNHLLPSARDIAMVFQSYALYPHMSVRQNLQFGLENQKMPKAEILSRVENTAEILQMSHLLNRRPNQLSGGQSQRVAIGRAIVKEPKAFLLDEPLSNLDAELRIKMRSELVSLHRRLKATMIYVTHDQVEAMTMADQIVVMRDGIIEQVGSPIEIYARPANQFVAGFIGAPQMNMIPVHITSNEDGDVTATFDNETLDLKLLDRPNRPENGSRCTIGIRPEHLEVSAKGQFIATIQDTEILGAETIGHAVMAGGVPITFSFRGIYGFEIGDKICLGVRDKFVHLFDMEGQTCQPDRPWSQDYIVDSATLTAN